MIENKLILVKLDGKQITRAKEINGSRKKITHVVICGQHGQIFGTETFCRKYYSAWSRVFSDIFLLSYESDDYEVVDFISTFNLVNILIDFQSENKRGTNV